MTKNQLKEGPRLKSRGKPVIDPEMCKGCELCIGVCPEKVLSMSIHYNSQGVSFAEFDTTGICTACKSCAIICPDCAITIYKYESGDSADA